MDAWLHMLCSPLTTPLQYTSKRNSHTPFLAYDYFTFLKTNLFNTYNDSISTLLMKTKSDWNKAEIRAHI